MDPVPNPPMIHQCQPVQQIDGNFRLKAQHSIQCDAIDNFDFSAALFFEFDIVDKILSYLPYRDLKSLAQINESWANIVRRAYKKRIAPGLFSFELTCYKAPESVTIKPILAFVLIQHEMIRLSSFICLHTESDTQERKTVREFLQNDLVTEDCPLLVLSCRQISSSFTKNKSLNGVVFPFIPNLNISVFRICRSNRGSIDKVIEKHIEDDHHVVCLLTFGMCPNRRHLFELVTGLKMRQPDNFALGGGYVRGMQLFKTEYERCKNFTRKDCMCVAFTKPNYLNIDFNAYSIVISEDGRSESEVEQNFINLKTSFKQRKQSIALRFTCISAQDEVKKEMDLFAKHFPNIEIIGFDGDGEIGWNCNINSPTLKKANKVSRIIYTPNVFHSFTSVIVLMTWGDFI